MSSVEASSPPVRTSAARRVSGVSGITFEQPQGLVDVAFAPPTGQQLGERHDGAGMIGLALERLPQQGLVAGGHGFLDLLLGLAG